MRSFRRAYGAGPVHLVAILVSFGVAAYGFARALELTSSPDRVLLWFGGSIVAHDLVLFPIYAVIGAAAAGLILPGGRPTRLRIAVLNHLRFPALLSGLLLLVWYPLIAAKGEGSFMRVSGLSKDVYFERWLTISAVLFGVSALILAVRVLLHLARHSARQPGRS
jgi:hypothetical protein